MKWFRWLRFICMWRKLFQDREGQPVMDTPLLPSLTIRPMLLSDTPRVYSIDVLSFSMPWSERSYRYEVTENKHSCNWVVEVQHEGSPLVVAALVIWVILDEAHIATIATHPDFRQRGIARRLLAHGLLAAYERGARLAHLEVRRGNLPAQAMYHGFGFEIVGVRPKYYKDNNEDALLMTLPQIHPQRLEEHL